MHILVIKMHKSVIDKGNSFWYNKIDGGKEDVLC